MEDCFVSGQCTIFCKDEKNELWMIENIPESLKNEYNKCRNNQHQKFQEALQFSEGKEDEILTPSHIESQHSMTLRNKRCQDDENVMEILGDANKIRQILEDELLISEIKFARLLGQGVNGIVFEICNPSLSSLKFVVKISKNNSGFKREFSMQQEFYRFGLTVKPITYFKNMFVMGKIDGILTDMLTIPQSKYNLDVIIFKILDLLFRICNHNLTHNDLHFGNLAYIINIETKEFHLILIDFGFATFGCHPEIELLQLIRSSFIINENMTYIREKLSLVYQNNYQKRFQSRHDLDIYYNQLIHETFHQEEKDAEEEEEEEEELEPTNNNQFEEYNL